MPGPTLKIRREDLLAKLTKVRAERIASFEASHEQNRKDALAKAKADRVRTEAAIKALEAKKSPGNCEYAWRWDPSAKPNVCNLDRWIESITLDTRDEISVTDQAYVIMFEHTCGRR